MLNNKQIAANFDLLAKLMELHDENPFKIRSYANAFLSLRKLEGDPYSMTRDEYSEIKGVGSAIADKIIELLTTGEMKTLQKYKDLTPPSIQEMLSIKGLGPKKVKQIWKEMNILTVGELLYACNENRLVSFKGFGVKAQDEIKEKIEYFMDSRGKFLYAHVCKFAEELRTILSNQYPSNVFYICGDIRRQMPEVCGVEIITDGEENNLNPEFCHMELSENRLSYRGIPVFLYYCDKSKIDAELFARSCSADFLSAFDQKTLNAGSEEQIFSTAGVQYIPSECRERPGVLDLFNGHSPDLITTESIKGIVHNHSTYSDGLHTLQQMAEYVRQSGYEYFVISDHSKSAGYAGGLTEDRVIMQWAEIDSLNASYGGEFRIFKGIESDILTDGSLDYSEEILKGFDVVIASVHSVLQMDETKATTRLIKAVENPYTRILGHPTGRLLLARPGYPVDYKKVLDACAANGVVMELNANPQRLDMDWTWIEYALNKSVMVAINPDAHSMESIHYISYGVAAARKGILPKSMCLNTKSTDQFQSWLGI